MGHSGSTLPVPVVLGVAALLLAIIGCVLMITNRFAAGVVALIFAGSSDCARQLSVHHTAGQVRVVGRPAR